MTLASDGLSLSELDRRLIHLLQIAPRVAWSEGARILGVSRTTLAARWQRLSEGGAAWITVYPDIATSGWLTVFVEVDATACSRSRGEVIDALCARPEVLGLSETDLLQHISTIVLVPDWTTLERFLLDDLPSVAPGIRGVARIAVKVHAEASHWRLDALSAEEQSAAASLSPGPMRPSPRQDGDDEVIAALIESPRASVAELSRQLGAHPSTLRRALRRLIAEGQVRLRCDLAPSLAGWPIERTWLLSAPPLSDDVIAARLRGLREVRLAATMTGAERLGITTLSRTLEDSISTEQRLLEALPGAEIRGRLIHLPTRKRMGRILNDRGQPLPWQPHPQTIGGLQRRP